MARPDDELISFVLKPENIESALDLAEVVPLAIDQLHIEFWEKLKEIVEQRLIERGATDEWDINLFVNDRPGAEPKDFIKSGGQLELTTKSTDSMPLYWAYWVEQNYDPRARSQREDRLAPLICGFGFASESHRLMKQQATSLPQWAKKLYDQPGVGWQRDRETLDWGYVAYSKPAKLRARGEIIRLAQSDDSLEREVAELLFELFDKTHKDILKENSKRRDSVATSRKPRRP